MALNLGSVIGYLGLDADGVDEGLDKASEKISDGKGRLAAGAAAVGAAAGLAIAAGLAGAMDAQSANAKLAAQLDLTKDESAQAGKIAGKLYAGNYGESLDDVNEAVGAVMSSIKGMRNGSSADIQALAADALNLAQTFDLDVGRSAQVAGQLITTGLAKDGTDAFNLLTSAMQRVPAAVREDVVDAVDEYGPSFQQLGMSGQQAFSLLVTGAQKGMFGIDKTGDALKEFTIRATDMSTTSGAAFTAIGLDQQTMSNKILAGGAQAKGAFADIVSGILAIKDPSAQSQAALALFGTPLEDLSTKDIPKFLQGLQATPAALGDVDGAAARMNTTLGSTAAGNMESFKRQLQQGFVNLIGGKVLPIATNIATFLSTNLGPAFAVVGNAVATATHWLSEHKGVAVTLVSVIGALAAITAVHAAVMAVSAAGGMAAWLKGTKLISAATKVWTAVQWAWNAATAASPLTIIVIAIIALVAAFVIAYKKSETFRNVVHTVLHAVGAAASWLWNSVLKPVFGWIGKAWGVVSAAIGWAWDHLIKPAWNAVSTAAQKLWGFLKPIFSFIGDHWRLIVGMITGPIGFLLLNWDKVKAAAMALWHGLQTAWNAVVGAVRTAIDAVVGFVVGLATGIADAAVAVWDWFTSLPGKIWGYVSAAATWLYQTGIDLLTGFGTGIVSAAESVWSWFSGLAAKVWGYVSTAATWLYQTGIDLLTGAYNGVVNGAVSVWNWFTSLGSTVLTKIGDIGSTLFNVGKDIVTGIWDGISGAAGWLWDKISGFVKDIGSHIASFLGIGSPSKVMRDEIGQWIPKGIAVGITAHSGAVDAAMRDLVAIPPVTVPSVAGLVRGGDGAAMGSTAAPGAGGGRDGRPTIVNHIKGWEAREVERYNAMQIGPF